MWYSQTESKIYSEARERDKKPDGSLGDEISEHQIKINEENLRAKYYRDSLQNLEPVDPDADIENYYERLEKLHDKIERSNN